MCGPCLLSVDWIFCVFDLLLCFVVCFQVYNETCHDLYQKGDAVRANLPVYEDESEGYQVRGRGERGGGRPEEGTD